MKKTFLAAALTLVTFLTAQAQTAYNISFQDGTFGPWQQAGSPTITSAAGTPAPGTNQALIQSLSSSGTVIGAADAGYAASFLGVNPFPGNSRGNPTDAQAIRLFVPVPGKLTVTYAYQTNEAVNSGYDETGVVVNGGLKILGDTRSPGVSAAFGKGFTNGLPSQTLTLTINPASNLIGFFAYNTGDESVSTGLYVYGISFVPQLFAQTSNLTPNQQSVAKYVDQFDMSVLTGDFGKLVANVAPVINNGQQLGAAFDQISPQKLEALARSSFNNAAFTTQYVDSHLSNVRTGVGGIDASGVNSTDNSLSPMLGQIKSHLLAWNPITTPGVATDARNPVLAGVDMKDSKDMVTSKAPEDRWSAFVNGNVILADISSSQDLAHAQYETGGVQLGADYRITDNITLGALFGYGHTDLDLDQNGSKGKVDSYTPGIYAGFHEGGWYGNTLFTYSHNDYTESRVINIGTLNGTAAGSPSGDQFLGNLTTGYEFKKGNWRFGPEVGVTYVNLTIDQFNESGTAALNINKQNDDSLRTRFGGRVSYSGNIGKVTLTPHLGAFWQHEFMDDSRGITAQFNQIGSGSFTVQTTTPERDSALAELGLDAQVTDSVLLFTNYLAQAGQSDFFAQSVQAGLTVGF